MRVLKGFIRDKGIDNMESRGRGRAQNIGCGNSGCVREEIRTDMFFNIPIMYNGIIPHVLCDIITPKGFLNVDSVEEERAFVLFESGPTISIRIEKLTIYLSESNLTEKDYLAVTFTNREKFNHVSILDIMNKFKCSRVFDAGFLDIEPMTSFKIGFSSSSFFNGIVRIKASCIIRLPIP